jgi:hypothetical protein
MRAAALLAARGFDDNGSVLLIFSAHLLWL